MKYIGGYPPARAGSNKPYNGTAGFFEGRILMVHAFSRTELLLGVDGIRKLNESTVAVFGIGGVGSYTVEGLARCGVGKLILVDDDCVCLTNINRQIHATCKTIGMPKVDVMKQRILEINPGTVVETYREFYCSENSEKLINSNYNYVVDAIDTISSKIDLVVRCKEHGIPIISSMGAGNKLDATRFRVSDIYKTSADPIAKIMRKELKKRGIETLKVVYSTEEPIKPVNIHDTSCETSLICSPDGTGKRSDRRHVPGSISFIPSVVGLIIAGEVVKDLTIHGNRFI